MSKMYKPSEVAELLGCSIESVYRWIKSGELKARKLPSGRGIRVSEADLEDAMPQVDPIMADLEEMSDVEE